MKLCPGCGKELDDGVLLCPLCGAAVSDAPAEGPEQAPSALGDTLSELADERAGKDSAASPMTPDPAEGVADGFDAPAAEVKPKKKRGAVFAAVAVVCAAALGLVAWLGFGASQGTDKDFLAAHQALFQSIGETELAPFTRQPAAEPVNIDMTLTAQVADSLGETAAIVNDAALRIQMEGGKGGAILAAALDLGGETYLEATVTGNKDGVVGFYIPQFSETYYIMDYFQFVENNSGVEFTVDDGRDDIEAWERIMKTYGDILADVVNKDNVRKESGVFHSFNIPAVEYPGTAYIFQPSARDLEIMLTRLADALEKDRTLVTVVDGLTDDMLAEMVDEIRANGAEAAQAVVDSGFTWTIRVGEGNYARNAQIELSWENGKNAICFDRLSNAIYFGVIENGEESFAASASYYEAEDGTWHGNAGVTGIGGVEWENVDLDDASSLGIYRGFYTIVNEESEKLASLEVAPVPGGGTDHTFQIQLDESDDTLTTLNLHTTDQPVSLSVPDTPVEDITAYTTEDFEALGESWSEGIYSLVMRVMMYAYQYQ